MAKGDGYTIGFAAAVCLVCSLLLATVSTGLRDRQERLAEQARQMNVLRAFGANLADSDGRRFPMERMGALFSERVEPAYVDASTGRMLDEPLTPEGRERLDRGGLLPMYRWREDGTGTRFAFPVAGPGLWGPIRGYLALENDGITIAGLTFYDQQETPGLGGEIEQAEFQEQFRGKTIYADGERRRVRIVKGAVRDRYPEGNPHAVDGISGATLTGEAVEGLINKALEQYEVFFARLRGS